MCVLISKSGIFVLSISIVSSLTAFPSVWGIETQASTENDSVIASAFSPGNGSSNSSFAFTGGTPDISGLNTDPTEYIAPCNESNESGTEPCDEPEAMDNSAVIHGASGATVDAPRFATESKEKLEANLTTVAEYIDINLLEEISIEHIYVDGLPENAPPDANKELVAIIAIEEQLNVTAGGGESTNSTTTLSDLKELLQMGIDELTLFPNETTTLVEGKEITELSMEGAAHPPVEISTLDFSSGPGIEEPFTGTRDPDNLDDIAVGINGGEEMYIMEYLNQEFQDEGDALDEATNERRYLRKSTIRHLQSQSIGTFAPLSCNAPSLPTSDQCKTSPGGLLSTLVVAAKGGAIIIPCGKCYKYDLPSGENTIGGLNIIGKLYIPPNNKSTLKTPYVFVQGELEMSDINPISPDNVSMRIILTGTTAITFTPADSNAGKAGTPLNVGSKPFLIAGGKLNVRGWDSTTTEGTATWTPLLAMAEGERPYPALSAKYRPAVPLPSFGSNVTCPRQIVNHDFNQQVDHSLWTGGEGAIISHNAQDGTMVVTNIRKSWQGFRLDFTKFTRECPLVKDQEYLITMRIKIMKDGMDGQTTECEKTNDRWGKCLRLTRKILLDVGSDRYYSQMTNAGTVGKYGEWFTFTTRWTYLADDLGPNVIGNIFALENTEVGTTISMDEFVFELPSEKSYPIVDDACSELIINGDAESTDGNGWSPYPLWSSRSDAWDPVVTEEVSTSGSINKFYRAKNRRWHSDSIKANLLKQCFVKGLVYTISLKVRIHYHTSLSYYVQLKGPKSDGTGWIHKQPLYCPEQSSMSGWVTCSGPFVIDMDYEAIGKDIEFEIIFDNLKDVSPWAVVDYDDLSISFKSGPAEGLIIDGPTTTRWGVNANIHITSSTLSNRDSQNGVIQAITRNADGSATLKLKSGIDAVISDTDAPGQGVEVAILSRNIKIEGESGGTPEQGGYLQVLHTPGVAQTIEGVEFVNMGQQKGNNRFAIQFLYAGNVPGTSVSRNSIRNSNHRCIVFDGTSNATISSNVAHDTAGHCYYFGHETVDNLVAKNIGSRTNNNISYGKHVNGHSDFNMCTFALYSHRNNYISNIAAGSDGHGFYMYNDWRTLGEDLVDTGKGNLRLLAMKTFKDNKAHSNSWNGFGLYDFEQFAAFRDDVNTPLFQNTMAYRNQNYGIDANNMHAAVFQGGLVADNQWGLRISRSDGITVRDMEIKGYTDILKEITTPASRTKLCRSSTWTHEGLRMMTRRWDYGEASRFRGMRLVNVTFSDFKKNTFGCPLGSFPIVASELVSDLHFDYTTSFQNITINDGLMIDGCKAATSYGVNDIVITDIDGSLDPSGLSSGPSAIISNFPHMTNLFGDACAEIPNVCMSYCTNICLRTVSIGVEQFGTENWKLRILNTDGASMDIPGKIQSGDYKFFSHGYRVRKFSASLPSGSYTAQFINGNGETDWPTFIEELWEASPDCAGSANPGDITFLKPEVDIESCSELVRNRSKNGSFSSTEPWMHTDTGLQIGIGLGRNNSDAIITQSRTGHWTGLGQSIDSRCTDYMRGQFFEFSAWLRVVDKTGKGATNINPNQAWHKNLSPILTLNYRQYRDVATKSFMYYSEDRDKGYLARPYKPNDWNLVHGIFRLPETQHVFWEIERAPDNLEFYIDDASITPFSCDVNKLWKNGALEESDVTKYWDTWGDDVGLTLVSPGYGGVGNAVKAFQRPHYSHGPAQVINMDCINVGDRLLFQARLKYETNGVMTTCNPYTWDSGSRCSDMFMFSTKRGITDYRRIAWTVSDPVDGWYHLHGVYDVKEHQDKAEFTKIYFDGTATSRDIIVDNVEVKLAPQNCQELVLNPSFDEGTSYWSFIDRGYSKVGLHTPGSSGLFDFALRSYSRNMKDNNTWRGVRQQLDKRCFVSGNEYVISAKFRLIDSATSKGVACDTNIQYNNNLNTQCPSVVVYGWQCQGGDVYWRFWNQRSNFQWNPEAFNDFEAGFTVNDQLASCQSVHVYIHQIKSTWEIIMDDIQISALDTEAPTEQPSLMPTEVDVTSELTKSPTSPPTSMPTVATVTSCPQEESSPKEISGGPTMLETSSSLCILTKAFVDADGEMTNIAPIARSYENQPWEKSSGDFANVLLYGLDFEEYTIGSQITLPILDGGAKYFLTSYSYSISDRNSVARLLESATFGTTRIDLESWHEGAVTKDSAAKWIDEQMKKPMTSHREFFRRRVNPRFTHPRNIGRPDHPCKSNSRWRKFMLSRKDGDLGWFPQYFRASFKDGDRYITLKLNGHVRSVVESISFTNTAYQLEMNKDYKMCNLPQEKVGGYFWLRMSDNSCQSIQNPPVTFYPDSVLPAKVLNLPSMLESKLVPIDLYRGGGEFILFDGLNDEFCNQIHDVTEETDAPVFGRLPDGSWLQFDPRLVLEENTADQHLEDGGGLVTILTGKKTRCSNAPRTFLNEGQCSLSSSTMACGSSGTPDLKIVLNSDNLAVLHNITGQYVYGVLGLPVIDFQNTALESPCTPGLKSRWEILRARDCTHSILGAETNATLVNLLVRSSDRNTYVRDIIFPISGGTCSAADKLSLANVELVIGSVCYKRVHPDHMAVFDFSYWALDDTHPGNMVALMEGEPNPIKKWMDIDGSVFLTYPSFPKNDTPKHPIQRWNTYSPKFPLLGRFGDTINFVDLPNELRLVSVAEYFGDSTAVEGSGVVVCGSPFEVENDPTVGYNFEVTVGADTEWGLWRQRENIWAMVGLQSEDQLRQRVAWALAQLLVVVQKAIEVEESHTEIFLNYYDIFVRNAFGNYGDILREIAHSPLMAENLSFLQSKSSAYMWETQGKISFADENFAREIMQLFSTGLYLLNLDGTPKLDHNGQRMLVYTNDEIMSFARIWTGFDYQQPRGNVEESSWSGNRHDPMRIQSAWRDKFPKSDLTGGYIGDGYPLCVDLPDKMFLRRGAKFRLLGSSTMPELMEDHSYLKSNPKKLFLLGENSLLKEKLCNRSNGQCQYAMTVTIDTNIQCSGKECDVDTVRVVGLGDGIFFEYVRPPCVQQVFFKNAKKVIYRERWSDSSCADPRLAYASEACCSMGDLRASRIPDYVYDQERVTYTTAKSRCAAIGKSSCDFNDISGIEWYQKGYHWSTDDCKIKVKVNAVGQVAIVYEPEDYAYLHPHIREDNRNFFKVYWNGGEYPKNNGDVSEGNNCGNSDCKSLLTGGCLCDTYVTTSQVFKRMPSVDEILSKLHIGFYDPTAYDSGTYFSKEENGVTAYFKSEKKVFDMDTFFEVEQFGQVKRFKNAIEKVFVLGASNFSFRNAPSFMSILNTEADVRDAEYETQAALDHYLYHDNTAPFIAYRLIQRFTTSNPNPRYVREVATAFRTGKYDQFGTGMYGDLSATIAAILLDQEARSIILDADPFHGALREPVLRVMALMRSMELRQSEKQPIIKIDGLATRIGQMAHAFPTVFSFFLPEYSPDGRPGEATLVAPETMILDMPKIVGLLNGMFSLVKYGLTNCDGGFGSDWSNCVEGDFSNANSYLALNRPFDALTNTADAQAHSVVEELATLLTSGRLSNENKQVVKNAYIERLPDAGAALRLAIQLILTCPEFHTTNTIRMSGNVRERPEPSQSSGVPYKSIVYVMFGGGCDSFNMLVPHTCLGTKDLYQEYLQVREEIALPKASLLPINATSSNQVCESFGVHPQLKSVQKMYVDGDLLFFTNTGVLTKETDKENYYKDTETQLFAHNWMQYEAQRVDPLKKIDATGILGRISDSLSRKGLNVGSFSIETNSISLIGEPSVTPTPFILSRQGVSKFNNRASSNAMDSKITSMNEATTTESGAFADLWSETLLKSITDNKQLYDTVSGRTTSTVFPNSYLGTQLQMVAKMISTRDQRGVDADMFFLSTGGWDTHQDVEMNLNRLFADVDSSFNAFATEMKAMNVWKSVTVIETSDFARTLAPNTGRGSDHAWGGNYMMFGGSVKGGQIIGKYPDNLTDDGERSLGRGRMIPSTSWDAVFLPLAEWAGSTRDDFDKVCPNRKNFPASHFFDTRTLFEM